MAYIRHEIDSKSYGFNLVFLGQHKGNELAVKRVNEYHQPTIGQHFFALSMSRVMYDVRAVRNARLEQQENPQPVFTKQHTKLTDESTTAVSKTLRCGY